MKEKKPFKLGATYKLKKRYVDDLRWTDQMREHLGDECVFKFKVTVISEDGVAGTDVDDKLIYIAQPDERKYFKRIDNK